MRIVLNEYPAWANLGYEALRDWMEALNVSYKTKVAEMVFSFMNDKEISEVNLRFLNHDYPTDIITFQYNEGQYLRGEVFIGLESVIGNADRFNVSNSDELDRVMAHGFLHVIGYDDQSVSEKMVMREEEDKCLILRPLKI